MRLTVLLTRYWYLSLFLGILTLALSTPCCLILTREPLKPIPEEAVYQCPWGLRKDLILPSQARSFTILVSIERGRLPNPKALTALASIASRYANKPAEWKYLKASDVPLIIDSFDTFHCRKPLDASTQTILINYVSDMESDFASSTYVKEPSCASLSIPLIIVNQKDIDKYSFLWLTSEYLEERTLVHEYGHLLGLGENPNHSYYPSYPLPYGGPHCVNADCALSLARPRSIFFNLFYTGLTFRYVRDYCSACRRDIESAITYWQRGDRPQESPVPTRELPYINLLPLRVRELEGKTSTEIEVALRRTRDIALVTVGRDIPGGWPAELLSINPLKNRIVWHYQTIDGTWHFYNGDAYTTHYTDKKGGVIYIRVSEPKDGVKIRPIVKLRFDASDRCTYASSWLAFGVLSERLKHPRDPLF